MKKIFTLFILVNLVLNTVDAQEFFQKVEYRGAFAPSPSPMWTSGWTEFNPQLKVYPTANVNVDGITVGSVVSGDVHITTNTIFTSNNVYLLKGAVYVDSLVTLTIQPGTVIRGDNTIANSSLIIRRGAKLIAEGTSCNPIVFTSNKAVGSRAPGDWGGVILLGRGSVNQAGGVSNIEGLTISNQTQYGGGSTPNDADSSGVLKYVRIEYGGYVFAANKEINGLTFGAVGSGTVIDYVQCSFINDDSFEWFGGKVNCSHLIAYKGTDDDFDTDFGYSGNVQFGLGLRDPNIFDPTWNVSGGSVSEGFESDNDAASSALTPKTKAIFSNMTIIGPFRGSLANACGADGLGAGFKRCARLRRNTELKIFNSVLMDFGTGLHIDGVTTESNATNGLLKFKNNILSGYFSSKGQVGEVNSGSTFDIKSFIASNNNDTVPLTAGILLDPYKTDDSNSDFRPGTLASKGASFTDPAFIGGNLPVLMGSFYGFNVKEDNQLYWYTITENNNKGFYVQRSFDGITFLDIQFVASKAQSGNSSTNIYYDFTDIKAFAGKSLYRIKQVDKDGKTTLSSIVEIAKALKNSLLTAALYPNPSKDKLNILLGSQVSQSIIIILTDMFGRQVSQKVLRINVGNNNFQFDVQSLSIGTYAINFMSENGTILVQKFVKQ